MSYNTKTTSKKPHSKIDLDKYHDNFLFVPLGGANEIGMNFNLYHHQGKWMIIDCGVGFAEQAKLPGVTLVLPNIDFIIKNKLDICGMVITHIHEDHIGGVIHLWQKIKCPVWSTPIAATFLEEKFTEVTYKERPKVNVIADSHTFNVGPFKLEFIGLTHSVPEMKAVALDTPFGTIFHTGDWKLDDNPVVGNPSEYKRIKEIAKRGVYAAICDSTNVFNKGWSGSEGDLEKNILEVVKKQKGRVVLTTFASNIARLKTISNVARRSGRKLVVAGKSIIRMIDVAQKNGYLLDCVEFLDQKEAIHCPREKVLILCTGCQGEKMAALTKIAGGDHPHIRLEEGDTVLFSSKIIPGNEKSIFATFNHLAHLNVNVVTEKTHDIHVSGHPYRDELKKLYSMLKPKYAIPVHGEAVHIKEHCEFAVEECGVDNYVRVQNGDVILMAPTKAHKIGTVESGYTAIDGFIYRRTDSLVIKERLNMAENGQLTCLLVLNASGNFAITPKIMTQGFLSETEDKASFNTVYTNVKRIIDQGIKQYHFKNNQPELISFLQKNILHICQQSTGKNPLVNIVINLI